MIPFKMLTERPLRLGATLAGLAVAFFLSTAQSACSSAGVTPMRHSS